MVMSPVGIGPENALAGPAATVNDSPVLLSERAPHINKPATVGSINNLVLDQRWVLHTKPDRTNDSWS
jgi:hypothetical protein